MTGAFLAGCPRILDRGVSTQSRLKHLLRTHLWGGFPMPPSPENNDRYLIQQAADQHAEEILARRRGSRSRRAAALAAHPQPLSIKTELTQVPLAAAAAPAPVSTTAQTAGYLL